METDTRRGERDARRAGEAYGREYARGADDRFRRDPIKARVDPVTAEFESVLRAQVAQIASRVNAKIPLTASVEKFRQSVAAKLTEIERNISAKIPADPVLARDFRRNLVSQIDREMRRVRTRTTIGVDVDRNRITQSLSSIAGLFGRFGEKVSSVASTAIAPVNKVLGAFNLSLSGVITALIAASIAAPPLAAAISVIGGSAVAAFGAISAGVVGLPALLTTLIAPIAAITLGMDGIKRAAAPLKDEFDLLKNVINTTFELNMRPVFEKLQAIFPTLTAGLSETARAVSRVAMDFAGILTTPSGIENIRVALAGVSDAIDRMRPGLSALFTELLNVAGARELYDILGETIGGVAERFAGMVERVRSSGDLAGALEQLRDVLFSVSDLLFLLAEGAIKFFRAAGPGLKSFFDSLVETLSRVNWKSLGESFGGLMERLGKAIAAIPPEKWQQLADAIGKLTEKFMQWVEGGGIEAFISGISAAASILSFFADNWLRVMSVGEGFMDFVGGIPDAFSGIGSSVSSALSGIPEAFDTSLGGLPGKTVEAVEGVNLSIDEGLAGIPEKIGGFFSDAQDRVSESWDSMTEKTSESLEGFGGRIDEFFSTLPDRIGYWIGYTTASAGLLIASGVESIAGFFATLPGRLEAIAADMAARTIAFFAQLPGQLSAWVTQAVENVVATFALLPVRAAAIAADMFGKVTSFFASLPGRLRDLAGQAVEAVVNALRELPAKAAEWARKTIDDILRFFRELPGKLLQAGKDAIQGFIDGVKQKAQSVVDAAKNVVNGAIRGARDALRSGSPSLIFRDIGNDTIQGYIIGVREKIAPLLAQVKAVFAQAVAAAQSAAGGIDFGLGALNIGGQVTADAIGSATSSTADVSTLMDAMAAVFNAAEWRLDGTDLTLAVNRGNLGLGRR